MHVRPLALAVTADLPFPPRSGPHLRDLQNLELLDLLGYEVHVVAGARTAWPGPRGVGPVGTLHAHVPVPDEATTVSARTRRLWRLARGGGHPNRPGPWALAAADAGLPRLVDAAVTELRPQALLLRSTLAHLTPALRPRVERLVLDVHDCEIHLARSLYSLSGPLTRIGGAARIAAARRVDRMTALADESWVPSTREVQYLATEVPGARTVLVPNGVPVPEQPLARTDVRPELLLVGGFGYPPNEAAAIRLVDGILPLVRRRHPDAVATLVGRDLRPRLQRRWRDEPVTWLGVVDDLEPLYRRAAALVLAYDPSTDAGTPVKVAEALAQGVPVVATPNATRPLGLVPGEHVVGGGSDAELADGVCRLLDDPASAVALARRGHAWAREHLAPDRIAARLRHESCLGSLHARVA
jgi:glycosyltransferase involved in cell wall biosynthesis